MLTCLGILWVFLHAFLLSQLYHSINTLPNQPTIPSYIFHLGVDFVLLAWYWAVQGTLLNRFVLVGIPIKYEIHTPKPFIWIASTIPKHYVNLTHQLLANH